MSRPYYKDLIKAPKADNEGIYRFYDKHGRSRMKQGRLLVKVPEQVPEEETTP